MPRARAREPSGSHRRPTVIRTLKGRLRASVSTCLSLGEPGRQPAASPVRPHGDTTFTATWRHDGLRSLVPSRLTDIQICLGDRWPARRAMREAPSLGLSFGAKPTVRRARARWLACFSGAPASCEVGLGGPSRHLRNEHGGEAGEGSIPISGSAVQDISTVRVRSGSSLRKTATRSRTRCLEAERTSSAMTPWQSRGCPNPFLLQL